MSIPTDSWLYVYLIIPLLVGLARVLDVTLGTMRIVYVSRGNRVIAPILGFFEVFIWIIAIGQVMEHANNLISYAAYAAGFATGNYIGLRVEEKLAVGLQLVRFITPKPVEPLRNLLHEHEAGSTLILAQGTQGNVNILYSILPRKKVKNLLKEVNLTHPDLFYSIEDIRSVKSGVFPTRTKGEYIRLRGQRRGK